MRLGGMMLARNEEHEIGLTLRVALSWCDFVVVLVHASTDKTSAIVMDIVREPGNDRRVVLVEDRRELWDEMGHRQLMLQLARENGATHLAIVDADELLTANYLPFIRQEIERLAGGNILQVPGYNLRNGLTHYHASGIWANRHFSLAFVDLPGLNWSGDRFHHREPMGADGSNILRPQRANPGGAGAGIMHLWGADEYRLKAKHAWYKLTERVRWPGKPVAEVDKLYSLAIHGSPAEPAGTWSYAAVPREWFNGYDLFSVRTPLYVPGGEPWQIAECRRILSERPELRAGLDLFGIV